MATPTTSEATFTYKGRKVTYAQYRYLTALDQQVILGQVNNLAMREARQVIYSANGLSQQEMGGFLRQTLPALVDKYGNINGAQAVSYYQANRDAWWQNRSVNLNKQIRANQNKRASRFALAKLQGQIYKASLPSVDVAAKTDTVVNYAMSLFMDKGFQAMDEGVQNALTRAVASYHRDTILYNSALDNAVYRVQRVADANACAFCQTVAFESYRTRDPRTADYAIQYHDHCHCTIETLYEGDEPIRPDYYDTFEQNYLDATDEVGTKDSKAIFAQIRKNTGAS